MSLRVGYSFVGFLVWCLSFSCLCLADDRENEILKLNQALTQECWFNGRYQQEKSIPGLPILLKSSGRYLYDCQRGVIWQQTDPLTEGFLFTLSGANRQILPNGQLQALSARYQKLIGRLMLVLLSGNEKHIDQHFSVTLVNNNPASYELVPKGGRLKKAIQSVFVMPSINTTDGLNQLEINIVDRSGQITRLTSQTQNRYADAESLALNCRAFLGDLATQSCDYFVQLKPIDSL